MRATFDVTTSSHGFWTVGFVLFAPSSGIVGAAAMRYEGIADPYVFEALGMRDCVADCFRRQLQGVTIDSDAKLIIYKCFARDVGCGR
ncbi:unnamed protein product [Linum trigynum]|uniref:Uncharacterized protein n=1 Tax=Linum trigynum TaxID=586398 RepID=A0AAV2FWC7_9ROSI